MNKLAKIILPVVTVMSLAGGTAFAQGGGSGGGGSDTWPTQYPLPLNPGTLISQTKDRATVRSTDEVFTVRGKLRDMYVTQKGCVEKGAVNKDLDFFCFDASTKKTDEVYFTFAALDLTFDGVNISQTNAFYVKG
jgi:hypothetical protein